MHIMSIVTYERRDNMGSTRYIMSIGELSRKDNSICFRKNGKNVYQGIILFKRSIIEFIIVGFFKSKSCNCTFF